MQRRTWAHLASATLIAAIAAIPAIGQQRENYQRTAAQAGSERSQSSDSERTTVVGTLVNLEEYMSGKSTGERSVNWSDRNASQSSSAATSTRREGSSSTFDRTSSTADQRTAARTSAETQRSSTESDRSAYRSDVTRDSADSADQRSDRNRFGQAGENAANRQSSSTTTTTSRGYTTDRESADRSGMMASSNAVYALKTESQGLIVLSGVSGMGAMSADTNSSSQYRADATRTDRESAENRIGESSDARADRENRNGSRFEVAAADEGNELPDRAALRNIPRNTSDDDDKANGAAARGDNEGSATGSSSSSTRNSMASGPQVRVSGELYTKDGLKFMEVSSINPVAVSNAETR